MKTNYDLIVVGAGPAGSIAAKTAAEKNISVLLLEKDREVGSPVRCAEAVRKDGLEQFIKPDKKWINTEIDKFSFNAPDGREVIINTKIHGYILERRVFDYELAKEAANTGVDVITKAYVNGLLFEDGKVSGVKYEHLGEQRSIQAKVIIAADGVESRVGRWAGIKTNIDICDMESCVQVTASNINIKPNVAYFYLGNDIAPHGYLWIFPKGNDIANIGVGITGLTGKKHSALSFLKNFLAKNYPEASILTMVAGGVPCSGYLDKLSAPGIMLVGDAARQTNPLTGGGIISGMTAGRIAGRIAAGAVISNDFDQIKSYDFIWRETLGRKHDIYNGIKKGIFNFSDEKYNKLAEAFNKVPEEKRTLNNLFRTALLDQPMLLLDLVKVFI